MAPLLASLLFLFLNAYALDITPNPDLVLGSRVPNVELVDEGGRLIRLKEISEGRPLLVSFVYTRCTSACPMIVEGVRKTLKNIDTEDFTVLLVDFDERDTARDLIRFRSIRGIEANWRLVLARGENLKRLTEALDFKFYYDDSTDMFAHPNVLVVLSPDLKVSGYMLGVSYDPEKLSRIIAKARQGKVYMGWVKGLLLKCFRYDPVTGTYTVDWSFVAMVAGGLVPLSGMLYFLFLRDLLLRLRRAV